MLTVSDNHIVLGGGGGGGGGDVVGAASSTDNAIARFDGVTGKLLKNSSVIVTDAGNVGIGATAPLTLLQLEGENLPQLTINKPSAGAAWRIGGDTTTSNTFNLALNSTNFVTVDTGGNVGIGATSPTQKFDVNGTSRFRGNTTFNGQIIDNLGSSGVDGQVLKKVGGKVVWSNP